MVDECQQCEHWPLSVEEGCEHNQKGSNPVRGRSIGIEHKLRCRTFKYAARWRPSHLTLLTDLQLGLPQLRHGLCEAASLWTCWACEEQGRIRSNDRCSPISVLPIPSPWLRNNNSFVAIVPFPGWRFIWTSPFWSICLNNQVSRSDSTSFPLPLEVHNLWKGHLSPNRAVYTDSIYVWYIYLHEWLLFLVKCS